MADGLHPTHTTSNERVEPGQSPPTQRTPTKPIPLPSQASPPASWHSWQLLPCQACVQHQVPPAHLSSLHCCGQRGWTGPQRSIPARVNVRVGRPWGLLCKSVQRAELITGKTSTKGQLGALKCGVCTACVDTFYFTLFYNQRAIVYPSSVRHPTFLIT